MLPASVVVPVEEQDRSLVRKLQADLPGIFNWALDGLSSLRALPASGADPP